MVLWVELLPHSKRVHGSNLCVELACSPGACMRSFWVLRLLPTIQNMQVRLFGYSKLTLEVRV